MQPVYNWHALTTVIDWNETPTGKSCVRIEGELKNDQAFKDLASQKKWKPCPGCGHMVEKSEGKNWNCGRSTRKIILLSTVPLVFTPTPLFLYLNID